MSVHLLDPAPPEEVVVVRPERGPADLSEARDRDLIRRIRTGDEEAFQAGAEAYPGGGAAAEVFDEVVVAAAAAEGVLGAQSRCRHFPESLCVVVEASDQVRVHDEVCCSLFVVCSAG